MGGLKGAASPKKDKNERRDRESDDKWLEPSAIDHAADRREPRTAFGIDRLSDLPGLARFEFSHIGHGTAGSAGAFMPV